MIPRNAGRNNGWGKWVGTIISGVLISAAVTYAGWTLATVVGHTQALADHDARLKATEGFSQRLANLEMWQVSATTHLENIAEHLGRIENQLEKLTDMWIDHERGRIWPGGANGVTPPGGGGG